MANSETIQGVIEEIKEWHAEGEHRGDDEGTSLLEDLREEVQYNLFLGGRVNKQELARCQAEYELRIEKVARAEAVRLCIPELEGLVPDGKVVVYAPSDEDE